MELKSLQRVLLPVVIKDSLSLGLNYIFTFENLLGKLPFNGKNDFLKSC